MNKNDQHKNNAAHAKLHEMNEHQRIEHLTDGAPVYLPYAYAGHYAATDEKATPEVQRLLGVLDDPHPVSEKPCVVVALTNGQELIVAIERLMHGKDCTECTPSWAHWDQLAAQLEPGEMISAGMGAETNAGLVTLLVDAVDLEAAGNDTTALED